MVKAALEVGLGGYLGQKFERVSALVLAALTPHRGRGYLPRPM